VKRAPATGIRRIRRIDEPDRHRIARRHCDREAVEDFLTQPGRHPPQRGVDRELYRLASVNVHGDPYVRLRASGAARDGE
jgi:hypothetical protein